MFKFIQDREQEISLCHFAILQARCNKHNIAVALELEDILKSDGAIHKTKTKQRTSIINGWRKENKKLKTFFIEHKDKRNGYKGYAFRRGITDNRWNIEAKKKEQGKNEKGGDWIDQRNL